MAEEKQTGKESDEQRNRNDSGLPGGGQGRRDEVGKSGVYPMSGPWPEGDAPIQPEMSWGQGERGAEGYNDSGSSEVFTVPPDPLPGSEDRQGNQSNQSSNTTTDKDKGDKR